MWIRFKKKKSGGQKFREIQDICMVSKCIVLWLPVNIIYQGEKSNFIMKKHGRHHLNRTSKFNITSNNMYLHHVFPEIVQ